MAEDQCVVSDLGLCGVLTGCEGYMCATDLSLQRNLVPSFVGGVTNYGNSCRLKGELDNIRACYVEVLFGNLRFGAISLPGEAVKFKISVLQATLSVPFLAQTVWGAFLE